MMHHIEVLVLSLLPRYLRALTKNDGHFPNGEALRKNQGPE